MKINELTSLGIGGQFIEAWKKRGLEDLTEIQALAFSDQRLQAGQNAVIIAPTSAGKTFVGEALAVRAASSLHRAIYLVPYKAIAEEKYLEFSEAYRDLGIPVVVSSGDYAEFDLDIRRGDFGIAIIVYEKLVQLLVQSQGIISDCHLVVVDEVQLIRDKERGALLELLLARIKRLKPSPQIVCLSATVNDLGGFDAWLNAIVIETRTRPVPLWEGVIETNPEIVVHDVGAGRTETRTLVSGFGNSSKEEILAALLKGLRNEEQVLIFRTQVDETEKTANYLAQEIPSRTPSTDVRERILALEDSPARAFLEKYMDRPIAYHNGGLSAEERRLIEQLFREGALKVVVTTATLAAGVNLPADYVVVADYRRYSSTARTRVPIDVAEYKNCVGRAGRYGKRTSGTSLLLADSLGQTKLLEQKYIYGDPPKLESAIPMQSELGRHVLTAIGQQLANTESDIVDLFYDSFAFASYYQPHGEENRLVEVLRMSISRLLVLKLIEDRNSKLAVTPTGRVAARSGVSMATFETLERLVTSGGVESLKAAEIFASISNLEEMERLRPFSAGERSDLLSQWVNGESAAKLAAKFSSRYSVGHGRIKDLGEVAEWLLTTAAQISETLGSKDAVTKKLTNLACEAHFGLPAELVELAHLRALSRSDLLRLIRNEKGIKIIDPHVILEAEPKDFVGVLAPSKVVALKEAIARSIGEGLNRRKIGHLLRCDKLAAIRPLVERVYDARGLNFDRALEDLLNAPLIEIGARRFSRQGRGEPDLEIVGKDGTVVISATASDDERKLISWNKSREVLGSVGYTGIAKNFVVIGRPDFHHIALENAKEVSRKGERLLLMSVDVLVELCLLKVEGKISKEDLIAKLDGTHGCLVREELEELRTVKK